MPALLQSTAGSLWAEQSQGSRLDYAFTWELDGDTITASSWMVEPTTGGPTITGATFYPTDTSAFIGGGTAGKWYSVTNTITTASGRTDQQNFTLLIRSAEPISGTPLFPDPRAAVAAVRRDRLVALAASHAAGLTLADDTIWSKLVAAEGEAQRELRVFLAPTNMLPAHPSYDAEAAALVAAGERVAREPGYDYNPEMFRGGRWGLIELHQRPVIRVDWMRFAYPRLDTIGYEIPTDWFRPEGSTNRVNLVPTTAAIMAPFNAFILSAMGGGSAVPFMLQAKYLAGLADVRATLPDLANVVARMACISIVDDLLLPQSGSVSADGLSQSVSMDNEKHREATEKKLAKMASQLRGVRMVIV